MKKNKKFSIWITLAIFPVTHGDGLPVPETPDNFYMYSDEEESVFSYSIRQLQGMQITCQAQTRPSIRSQKASSMIWARVSNLQKIMQKIWHQSYNSGIYYTTPWSDNISQQKSRTRAFFKIISLSPTTRRWRSDRCNSYEAPSWEVAITHWCFKGKS